MQNHDIFQCQTKQPESYEPKLKPKKKREKKIGHNFFALAF